MLSLEPVPLRGLGVHRISKECPGTLANEAEEGGWAVCGKVAEKEREMEEERERWEC